MGDFFGIVDTPTFRICNIHEDFIKYKPENSEFTEDNLRAFVAKYKAGELEADLKSEDVPEDWDAAPVKVLVGKNFAEVAYDKNKDATANEVKDVKVRGFPTLKLFKKDNTIEDYNGGRDLDSFVKFLRPEAEESDDDSKEVKDEL